MDGCVAVTITYPGTEPLYWIVEVIQIFDGVADITLVPEAEIVLVNGEPAPVYDDTKLQKRWLYLVLSRLTGYRSPWGCLTGIRPAKMINMMFDFGISEAQIRKEFTDF